MSAYMAYLVSTEVSLYLCLKKISSTKKDAPRKTLTYYKCPLIRGNDI